MAISASEQARFRADLLTALLARRTAAGAWEGNLSSSALATATAVAALAASDAAGVADATDRALVENGIRWLVATCNADEGWGDTPDSVSNISTTALVWSALAFGHGAGVERAAAGAERWIARAAGSVQPDDITGALAGRYGKDRTFSVPILTMCAIAGRLGPGSTAWRLIPQLPFELSTLPRGLFGWLRLPVVSYALPALIAMGLARHRRGGSSPGLHALRTRVAPRALEVLHGLQPESGGFLEAVPLTSFVAMSLVAAGEPWDPVVLQGLRFLRRSVRDDGSWPIDSNLATWATTLSVNALASGEGLSSLGGADRQRIVDWLLAQQWRAEHPYTGAAPGGWAWTDLPGGVPDADDTAGALIALAHLAPGDDTVRRAAAGGVRWLLDLQNGDGGIPTFCRGWGALPFDRSATDLTAHALRAWTAWRQQLDAGLAARVPGAIRRAVRFLATAQRPDGSFVPLWFGNQRSPGEENPVFGTARVVPGLVAASELDRARVDPMLAKAVTFLVSAQNDDGGWGGSRDVPSSIEETGVSVTALATVASRQARGDLRQACERGVEFLSHATRQGSHFPPSPVGLYFARLWYSEALYPIIFAAGAVEAAHQLPKTNDQLPSANSQLPRANGR